MLESLQVHILHARGHKTVVGLDSEAHVDVLELADELLHPLAVGSWHLHGGHGSSLDHEIIH